MNKYVLGVVLLGAVLLMISPTLWEKGTEERSAIQKVSSTILVTGNKHDFGTIDIFGGKVQTTYTLKNEGTEDVTITNAQTSCMCTEGRISGQTFGMHDRRITSVVIPAGEEETVTANYDPLAHGPNGTGKVTRELVLTTNSTAMPSVRLLFSGNVIKNKLNE